MRLPPKHKSELEPDIDIPEDEAIAALWRIGILDFKLWTQQIPIYKGIRALPSAVQFVVILCARQFGKSYLGALLAVEDCLRNPGRTVLIVGPTKEQTVDIVHQSISVIGADAPLGLIRRSKSESRWYIGNSELVIGGFDIKNATRKRGRSLIKIYIEEVVDSDPDQYNESMKSDLGPALTHAPDAKMIFLTTPPKITDHPFITETIPYAQLENAFYKFTIYDNEQLTKQQYDACVQRCGGENTTEFKREYLCEIIRDEKTTIIPDFRKELHVTSSIKRPEHVHYGLSIDFGGVRDKTAALLYGYDFRRNKLLIFAERVYEANTHTNQIVSGLREMECQFGVGEDDEERDDLRNARTYLRYADCAGQLQIDLNAAHRYQVTLPLKDDWQAAINNMQLAFTHNEVEIDARCQILIATCESGQFNKQRTDFGRTTVLGHCDAIAALMYAIRMADRTNPYPRVIKSADHHFTREVPTTEMEDMAAAIQPKGFSASFKSDGFKPKRFGSFRR